MFPDTRPEVLKRSIKELRAKNPKVKLYLSVGGATYKFPSRMSKAQIDAQLKYCDFYGLDGIDLDYENSPACYKSGTKPVCATDKQLTDLIKDWGQAVEAHKKETGKPFLLTAAAFSVGAYYNGDYLNAKP